MTRLFHEICRIAGSLAVLVVTTMPARGDATFSPGRCGLAVTFPAPPVIERAAEAESLTTESAVLEQEDAALKAACTYGYPKGTLARLDDDSLVAFIKGVATRIGARSVSVERAPDLPLRAFVARVVLGDGTRRLTAYWVYADASRLIVEVPDGVAPARRDPFIRLIRAK